MDRSVLADMAARAQRLSLATPSAYLALLVHQARYSPPATPLPERPEAGLYDLGEIAYSMEADLFAWSVSQAKVHDLPHGTYLEALARRDLAAPDAPLVIVPGPAPEVCPE